MAKRNTKKTQQLQQPAEESELVKELKQRLIQNGASEIEGVDFSFVNSCVTVWHAARLVCASSLMNIAIQNAALGIIQDHFGVQGISKADLENAKIMNEALIELKCRESTIKNIITLLGYQEGSDNEAILGLAKEDLNNDSMQLFNTAFLGQLKTLLQNNLTNNEENIAEALSKAGEIELKTKLRTVLNSFDKDYMFVRKCYPELLVHLLSQSLNGCFAVCGDPGIGKSYFALYVFLALYRLGEKVVLVNQNGTAFVFDGNILKFEPTYQGIEWMQDVYWLLLDGLAISRYLGKRKRGIVFASPKKSNFHEFIKQNGSLLYMPPWPWNEVEKFVLSDKIQDNMARLASAWELRKIRREKRSVSLLGKFTTAV